jgi:peptidoglycan/LPS O-acetylase OafA/YrhL
LPALTGIRFLAALHVVLYHYAGEALATTHWAVRAIIACGPSAVSLFYVLSGAVLVYSCTTADGNLSGQPRRFWRARFARIYPTYLFALLVDGPFFISALVKAHDGAAIAGWGIGLALPVLLLLHGWTALTVFAWNVPGWSLSAEAFFYAVFPSWVTRLRPASTGALVRRMVALYGLVLVPPLLVVTAPLWAGALLQVQFPTGPGGVSLETWLVRLCGFSPIARLPEFFIGICLGHWLRRHGHALTLPYWRAAGAEALVVLALTAVWIALGSSAQSKPWLDSGLLSPLFAALIVVLAVGTGPMARLMSTGVLLVLGDASYALYILQEPVVIWTSKLPLIGGLPPAAFTAVFVTLLIGVSIACQRLLAEPARLWLLNKRPVAGVTAAVPA